METTDADGRDFLCPEHSHRLKTVSAVGQAVPLTLDGGRFRIRREPLRPGGVSSIGAPRGRTTGWPRGEHPRGASTSRSRASRRRVSGSAGAHTAGVTAPFSLEDDAAAPQHLGVRSGAHKLAHLHEPQHTPKLWRLLERSLSVYEYRKRWLTEHGIGVEVVYKFTGSRSGDCA